MQLRKVLDQIAYRHNLTTVFDDFLQMAVCAFGMGRMEERYLETAKRYNADEVKLFGHAMGAMMLDYEQVATPDGGWHDVLGMIFEELGSTKGKQWLGQFFTPVEVCNMMARITAEEDGAPEDAQISDPCCGSGRNLIAHCRTHPQNRYRCFYHAYDLDNRCVNMCVLNMVLYGMKGVVIRMNSLSLEIFHGYRVYLADTGLGVAPLNADQCRAMVFRPMRETAHKEHSAHSVLGAGATEVPPVLSDRERQIAEKLRARDLKRGFAGSLFDEY